jgi:hypothetical protein
VPRFSGLFLGIALLSVSAAAEENPGYIGAQACGVCHQEQFAAQSRSSHAQSLRPALEHPLADRFPELEVRLDSTFQHGLERRDNTLVFQVRRGDELREQVVNWAFGAGQQAVTFVSRLNEDFYVELRTSYYPGAGLDFTPGHQNHQPETFEEALGVRYKIFSPRSEILSCFGCHSTGLPSLGEAYEIRPAELGVRCESCHGPGRRHAALIAQGAAGPARLAIGNPGRLDPPALINFCGECHRPPASEGVSIDWSDPWNVRHQPVYLTQSACFQRSSGGLTCLACHNPHEPMRRNDTAYYNAQCLSCHGPETHPPAGVCRAEAGCASCHMPAVRPQKELAFHNHWIGVYAPNDPLLPQR